MGNENFEIVLESMKEELRGLILLGIPRPAISAKVADRLRRDLNGEELNRIQRLMDETKAKG